MRFRCLILDHDDTAVDSTAEIHYPAHIEVMRRLRPGHSPASLETWLSKNFDPGVMAFLTDELEFSPKEIEEEYRIWRSFTESTIPSFYPGILPLLSDFRDAGGRIAVVSHSEADIIERDYHAATSGTFLPDLIFGWDHDETRRKPHPWPVLRALERFGIPPAEALIVDDLKPAVTMGKASGVSVAAAGWGHNIAAIRGYMERHCLTYLRTVDEFRRLLLGA